MLSATLWAAALLLPSLAAAGAATLAEGNPHNITFTANFPYFRPGFMSGAVNIAAAPSGEGAAIQIALHGLPIQKHLSYGIRASKVDATKGCLSAGKLLDPYAGITDSSCGIDPAACQVGALSDKHGHMHVVGGGGGTGYFAAVYIDSYLSLKPDDPAYIGNGSIAIVASDGSYLRCANLEALPASASEPTMTYTSTSYTLSPTTSARNSVVHTTVSTGDGDRSSGSAGLAVESPVPAMVIGAVVMAALFV